MRWPAGKNLSDGGMAPAEVSGGLGFARGISLWRTAYSSITQARRHMPAEVGAIAWIAPYAPHYSTFLPIYANANFTPSAIAHGTQYKLDKSVNFWIHSLACNYLSRWYKASIHDTLKLQQDIEKSVFKEQAKTEADAVSMLTSVESTLSSIAKGNSKIAASAKEHALSVRDAAVKKLQDFHQKASEDINKGWWDFFWFMITKYRDIYQITDFHAENFAHSFKAVTYPRWWMEQVGYWGAPGTPSLNRTSVPIYPINIYSEPSPEAYAKAYPEGIEVPYPTKMNPLNPAYRKTEKSANSSEVVVGRSYLSDFLLLAVGAAIGATVSYLYVKNDKRSGYTVIRDDQEMPGLL